MNVYVLFLVEVYDWLLNVVFVYLEVVCNVGVGLKVDFIGWLNML